MASPKKLSNYLRANRKRLGLSQEEVAFLLGSESGAKVCRYEQLVREPELGTALAYEAILQKSVSELFPGLRRKIAKEVSVRAQTLVRRTERRAPNRQTERKRKALNDIITNQAKKKSKDHES
jgi:transcriptional regulator with XRE-family HTH domain